MVITLTPTGDHREFIFTALTTVQDDGTTLTPGGSLVSRRFNLSFWFQQWRMFVENPGGKMGPKIYTP